MITEYAAYLDSETVTDSFYQLVKDTYMFIKAHVLDITYKPKIGS